MDFFSLTFLRASLQPGSSLPRFFHTCSRECHSQIFPLFLPLNGNFSYLNKRKMKAYRKEGLQQEEAHDAQNQNVVQKVVDKTGRPEIYKTDAAQPQQLHHSALFRGMRKQVNFEVYSFHMLSSRNIGLENLKKWRNESKGPLDGTRFRCQRTRGREVR